MHYNPHVTFNNVHSQTTGIHDLQFALHAAALGTWHVKLIDDVWTLVMDDLCKELFGFLKQDADPIGQISQLVHHNDREAFNAAIRQALDPSTNRNYDFTFRINSTGKRWARIIGKGYYDDKGLPFHFSGIIMEVTGEKLSKDKSSLSENLAQIMLKGTGVGLFHINMPDDKIDYSPAFAVILTGESNKKLTRENFIDRIHPDDKQIRHLAYESALKSGDVYYEARTIWNNGSIHWIRTVGTYAFDDAGKPSSFSGTVQDITEEKQKEHALREVEDRFSDAIRKSEAMFRAIIEQAPLAIGLLNGREMIVETVNETILKLWGKNRSILGKPVIEALPEIKGQPFLKLLEAVYDTGKPYFGYGTMAKLEHKGSLQDLYFDFVYTPIRDANAMITGVMVLATEVTTQMLSRKAVEESEARFRGLIHEAPFATALYTGRELVIEIANEAMIHLWGKNTSVIGMPLHLALPEMEGQTFLKILDNIFNTGETYHRQDAKADLLVDGALSSFYFNFTYKPLKNEMGEVYAILNMAVDVTQQVLARKKIEEAQDALRGAVELAELGTWHINLETGILDYSDRLKKWFGFEEDEVITIEKAYAPVIERDRHLIRESMTRAISFEFRSLYDVEYTVVDKISGKERIIHAQGKAFFNEKGVAYKVSGTAQDVTEQRKIQFALETEVQKRTEELQVLNAELKGTNEELFKSNERLVRSNEELAQFAYVASHDLQEPLRKIRTFSNMLNDKESMSAESKRPVAKIMESAERMSMLIQDLLEFSRLLKSETLMRPIQLSEVCKAVRNDFELSIIEKNADVRIGQLPVIEAVGLQMNQLFYNLLSNALKFSSHDHNPRIEVFSRALNLEEVERHIPRPSHHCQYYQVTFADNGIGFDVKYSEQIFEVFKRLHGRDIYPGSGIGLALCRRIVANHKGYLYAESIPGQGAAFHIILPDKITEHQEN